MVSIWKGDGKKPDKFEIKDINPKELEEKKHDHQLIKKTRQSTEKRKKKFPEKIQR